MKTVFIPVTLAILTLGLCFASPSIAAESEKQATYNIAPLYQEVRELVRKYYPIATSHTLNNKIHFEYDTRIFIVHEPYKTGEWQDAREERGPKKDGIMGTIQLQKGPWQGAAVVPQTFNKRYFKVLLMAPYSKKLDAHIHVLIKYPRNVDKKFLKEITTLLNHFEAYVETSE